MNLQELIEQLQELVEAYGEDVEVRIAHQPQWPFEYEIGDIVSIKTGDADEYQHDLDQNRLDMSDEEIAEAEQAISDERDTEQTIVYIGERSQMGYLPGAAEKALGWGRG